MKAIILAGGKGTRLQSVISDIPKPMVPVAGKPFLEHLILQLKSWKIQDIVLSVGYKKENITSHFSNGSQWGVNISYIRENTPLGTGGAIREAVRTVNDRNIVVMNGDSFVDADIPGLIDFHIKKNALATLALIKMADAGRYGRVLLDRNGEITEFKEKQGSMEGLINAGMYIINRNIIPYLPDGAFSFESDVLPRLNVYGLYGREQKGFFIDIGLPDDYQAITQNPGKLKVRRTL